MSGSAVDDRRWSSMSALALLLFVAVSSALWVAGRGIPYGYDATDTYRTYLAGYNAATFPGVSPLIQDVAASPDPTAHPSYATDAPNLFANIVSQLLIHAGITNLAVQTALAILVSASGVVLASRVLSRLGGPALAAATTLLFSLQYAGVLTWTSNLRTAMYFPLFWGNLFLLQRYVDRPSRLRLLATAAGIAAVFLNDLAFGAFVLLTELFLMWQLPRTRSSKAAFSVAAGLGGGAALASWASIVALTLGPAAVATLFTPPALLPWSQIVSAYRDMFSLGTGGLTLLIYPLLLYEIFMAGWSALKRSSVERLTARTYVVAVGLAAIVLTVGSIGDFTARFIDGYRPSLVFAEDVILAGGLLALVCRFTRRGARPLESTVALGVVVVLGAYWLVYQGKLALRYPPTEISVASALRGNASLAGANFIAPDISDAVWYYTRGRAQSVDVSAPPFPTFLVCVRLPDDPPGSQQCNRYPVDLDQSVIRTSDYLIYPLPACGEVQTLLCARGPFDSAPPTLNPTADSPDSPRVDLSVTLAASGGVAHVNYSYSQLAGAPQDGSVIRLYVWRPRADWCQIDEKAGSRELAFPPASSGRFRVAVIPRSGVAAGAVYFSEAVDVRAPLVFSLPDIQRGGIQHITAASWQEAQQIALEAGTWNPAAGTLGPDEFVPSVDAPSADHLCRR